MIYVIYVLHRLLLEKIIQWKQKNDRKPLLLDGARQVGKSYLLETLLGREHFRKTHVFNFEETPALQQLFEGELTSTSILSKLELSVKARIDPKSDLIIFDEIGECEKALTSLKYFAEQQPTWHICASGSNIGLLKSFPVGKVEMHTLRPLNFEEYLLAIGSEPEIEMYQKKDRSLATHQALWKHFLDYLFVGGMPEAVNVWKENSDATTLQKRLDVRKVQRDILSGYERDFGKYSGKVNAMHLHRVFRNVPSQLEKNLDASTRRYGFKDVIEKKRTYRDFVSVIDWLEKAYLVSKSYLLAERPRVPLDAYKTNNVFKLFFLDVGLLCCQLGVEESILELQDAIYKGPVVENFVQTELLSYGHKQSYSWAQNTAQLEFLLADSVDIVPLEVKAGKNSRSRSLDSYKKRYNPKKTIKLIGSVGGVDSTDIVLPLYYTKYIAA